SRNGRLSPMFGGSATAAHLALLSHASAKCSREIAMAYRSTLGNTRAAHRRAGQGELEGTRPRRDDWIAAQAIPSRLRSCTSVGNGRPGYCHDSPAAEQIVLQVLRARGGRLGKLELTFELRWHSIDPHAMDAAVAELVERGLVRGPMSQSLSYELTT